MFDVGAPELLVIAIVLIVVVGPKDLPKMLRAFGKTTTKIRTMAGDFRRQFDEAMREAELDEVKNLASSVRNLDPLAQVKKELNPLSAIGKGIREDIEKAVKPDDAAKPMDTPEVKPAVANAAAVATAPLKGPVEAPAAPAAKAGAKKTKPVSAAAKPAAPKSVPARKAAPVKPAPKKAKGGKA